MGDVQVRNAGLRWSRAAEKGFSVMDAHVPQGLTEVCSGGSFV